MAAAPPPPPLRHPIPPPPATRFAYKQALCILGTEFAFTATMIRTPYDRFAKSLTLDRVSPLGLGISEQEIDSATQRADLWWTPDPRRLRGRRPRDTLDRMARIASLWEFFHRTPTLELIFGCVRELLAWHAIRCAEARAAGRPPPALPPPIWMVSSGLPRTARRLLRMTRMRGWPKGFYAGPPGDLVRLVVVRELPRTRATVLLRLMGAGPTLLRAIADIVALPLDAPERVMALPHIERLQSAVKDLRSPDGEEFDMTREDEKFLKATEILHQQFVQMTEQRGFDRGVEKGIEKGIERGIAPTVYQFARRLGRSLTETERGTLAARLDSIGPERIAEVASEFDAAALAKWLKNPRAR